jgi:hypothetical protein
MLAIYPKNDIYCHIFLKFENDTKNSVKNPDFSNFRAYWRIFRYRNLFLPKTIKKFRLRRCFIIEKNSMLCLLLCLQCFALLVLSNLSPADGKLLIKVAHKN